MIKRMGKKAIALISLAILLAVMIMLAGVVSYVASDMITNSKLVKFSKDMTTIYDAVQEYYAVNGAIPVREGGLELDVAEYKSNVTNGDYLNVLTNEIAGNQDENSTFFQIDMTKIGIEDSTYGIEKTSKDIFLVSNGSNLIYYYPGFKIKGDIYFSSSYILDK